MNYLQVLGVVGLSQSMAEAIIIFGLIAIGIGMVFYFFWHYIVIGLGIIGVLFIFAHHVDEPVEKPKEEIIIDQDKKIYMEDCESLTSKPSMCEELWKERQSDTILEPQFTLIDTDNEEYKKRRSEALKKPGVMVFHETLR